MNENVHAQSSRRTRTLCEYVGKADRASFTFKCHHTTTALNGNVNDSAAVGDTVCDSKELAAALNVSCP